MDITTPSEATMKGNDCAINCFFIPVFIYESPRWCGWRLGHYLTGEQCNSNNDTHYRCSQS